MSAHCHTPNLSVIDPRSLVLRSVGYYRDSVEPPVDSRITRQTFDALGRLCESWDPRLWGAAPRPNLATLYGLSGQPLLTDSVDAGWQLSLFNEAGSSCSFWDARGCQRQCEYDPLQRPITVCEQMIGQTVRVVEQLDYAGSSLDFTTHNQCGRLIRHDDPAGVQVFPDYGLAGAVLVEERRFLIELEPPDWLEQPRERDTWREDQRFITRHDFNAAGELRHQTDAMNNVQTFAYDVAGRLSETWLRLAGDGTQSQRLISDIRYNAHDQIESETAGNSVLTRAEYSADDGRLVRLIAQVRDQKPLQDLHYRYDPVGNIVELEDQSQAVSHFNNQRIEPINRYRYDSLYQLIEASGWEVSQPSHGPALPDLLPTPLDPTQRRNYIQRFEYDRAGNLITRHHSGAPGFSMFTSARSNRSLAQREDGSLPGEAEIDYGFDACGNQRELQRGQAMTWDSRNQLSRVTMIKRANKPDDFECYAYDRPGHRLRKVHVSQTSNQTLRTEVRYLPGLEIHRQPDGEEHHVISVEAGRCSVRMLHWPARVHADQLRYSLCDHLGSSTLELDHEAGVLTQEHYYAFGGTACWAGKSALVAKYKTIRYSGKERGATGLYFYGYRYYAPWLQRWICPDPTGHPDGLNRYAMVNNNPIVFYDWQGAIAIPADIFIADIVNPMNREIGTGWFEELIWDQEASTFTVTGHVYTRGMQVIEGEGAQWHPYRSSAYAIAMFRDQDRKLRLFVNTYQQHMGIQPGMGLPEFAGQLIVDEHDPSVFTITNHSGHYKPESTIDAETIIAEIAPQQHSISYIPVVESSGFDSSLRIASLDSPETYERLVNKYRRDLSGLIKYLKEQGIWEVAKASWSANEGMNIIFKMEATGLTAQQIYTNEAESRKTSQLREAEGPSLRSAEKPLQPPQPRCKKPSRFKSFFCFN